MSKDDVQALAQAASEGDRDAFEGIVIALQKPLYNVVYRMLNDAEEARDVTQTAFLKAYQNLGQYDPRRKLFSWLCRIAINEAIDRQQRSRPVSDPGAEAACEGPGPGELAQQCELHRELETALMALEPDMRAVVVLRHVAGLGHSDIARTLGIEEKTAKSRLFRARRQLRRLLEGEG